jgi:hypothetical protein
MTDTSRRGFLGMLSKAFGGAVAATTLPVLAAQETPAKVVYVEKKIYIDNTPKPPPYDPDAECVPWGRRICRDELRRIVPVGVRVTDTMIFFDENRKVRRCSPYILVTEDGETLGERLARILTRLRPDQSYWVHSIRPHIGDYCEPKKPNHYRIVDRVTWKDIS